MANPNEQANGLAKNVVAVRPPAPTTETATPEVEPKTKAPAGSVVPKLQPTVNFLSAFAKSVGSKADPNVTAVGVDFARHLGAIKGTNKSSKIIARSTANGRHASSNGLIQAYAAQGKKPPANVMSLMDQLDNLAAHANVVSQMDDTVRIQMIGQGNKELDPAVISAQESAILNQLNELTLDITSAEARLDFQKKQNDTAKSSVALNKSLLDYQAAVTDRNQKAIDQNANDILENMTEAELAEALKTGALPDGLPVAKATADLQKRIQLRASAVESLAKIDKTSQDSMSRVLSNFSLEVIEELEILGMTALESGDITGSVTIPNTEVSVPLTAIRDAKLKRAEIMSKNNEFDVKVVEQNQALIAGYANAANQLLEQNLTNPNSLMIIDLQGSISRASAATTAQESKEAADDLRKQLDTVVTSIEATIQDSDQKAAFKQRFINGGRNTFDVAANSFATRDPLAVSTMTAGNQFYTETTDFYYHLAANALSSNTAGGEVAALLGNNKAPTAEEQMKAVMADPQTATMMGEIAMGQLTEELFVAQLDGVFKGVLEQTLDPEFAEANPEVAIAIQQVIVNAQTAFFGDNINKPVLFSNKNNPNLVVPAQVQRFDVNEDGEREAVPMVRQDGSPLTMRNTNPNFILSQLAGFDSALRDAGYTGDSIAVRFLEGDTTAAVDRVTIRNIPKNGVQEEILNVTVPAYRNNPTASAEQMLSYALGSTFQQFVNTASVSYDRLSDVASLAERAREVGVEQNRVFAFARKKLFEERLANPTSENILLDQPVMSGGAQVGTQDRLKTRDELMNEVNAMSIEELLAAGALTSNELLAAVTATESIK